MLNIKQEKFIQNIVKGASQREAYKDAYKAKYKDDAIDNKASKLFNKAEVQARYKELIDQLEDKSIMNAKDRMKWLTAVINNEQQEDIYITSDEISVKIGSRNADLNTKLKALDTLNKMSGEYKTVLDGSVEVKKKLEDLL